MKPRPTCRTYSCRGKDEFALCFAADAPRRILIIPPLFDEMNRVRRMLVEAMRDLAARGAGSALVDLPGCNESLSSLEAQSLSMWREAVSEAALQLQATHIASVRGGALVDGLPDLPRWRLAPAKGQSLLKTMLRTRIAGDREAGKASSEADLLAAARSGPIELAGNRLGPQMVTELAVADAVDDCAAAVRLIGRDIAGTPLWLRAEPQDDAAMSAAIAADLDRWSATCAD